MARTAIEQHYLQTGRLGLLLSHVTNLENHKSSKYSSIMPFLLFSQVLYANSFLRPRYLLTFYQCPFEYRFFFKHLNHSILAD